MVKIVNRTDITPLPGGIGKSIKEAEKSVSQRLDALGGVSNMLDRQREAYKKRCAELLKLKSEERQECETSLYSFLENAWPSMERNDFCPGWHLEAVCEHLEAVSNGEINRLLINIPPRTGKTNAVSIAWPAWTWAQQEITDLTGPQTQFLCASYGHSLALDISTKCRRLLESDFYKNYWGDRFDLRADQNTKSRFDTSQGGSRIATSVGGALTGLGADIILVDDPHNAQEMESELTIRAAVRWFSEGLQSRLNNPKTGAIVVIMQRLSDEDLSGYILSKESGYTHLNLPIEYESSRHCVTNIGWSDPRTEENELLCPDRIGQDEIIKLKKDLGSFAFSGQYMQSPTPRGGGIIKDKWWKLYPEQGELMDEYGKPIKPMEYPQMEFIIAFADTAYTEKEENDPSALTIWGVFRKDGAPKVMLMAGWEERLELNDLVNKINNSCTVPKGIPVDRLIIENKASGKSVAQELLRLFDGSHFGVELSEPKGDKMSRMYSIQHLFENGIIYSPDREWAQMVMDRTSRFPKGAHDDVADTVSGALKWLRDSNFALRSDEHDVEQLERDMYRKPNLPLYDI